MIRNEKRTLVQSIKKVISLFLLLAVALVVQTNSI